MPRYTLDTLTAQVNWPAAIDRLNEMSEEDLVALGVPAQFPLIPALCWSRNEPEHDGLAGLIRNQLLSDLEVMYDGEPDNWCDEYLAQGYEVLTGNPTLSILFDSLAEEDADHVHANPVIRLRRFGLCKKAPTEPSDGCWRDAINTLTANMAGNSLYNVVTTTNSTYRVDDTERF